MSGLLLMAATLVSGHSPAAEATRRFSSVSAYEAGGGARSFSTMRSGALASGELHLVGLQLRAPEKRIDVPQGSPFVLPVTAWLGSRQVSVSEVSNWVPPTAILEATISGPGLTPQTLSGSLAAGVMVPGLPQMGDYQISGIRLKDGSRDLYDVTPGVVTVRCLGEVILSQVSSTPMTMDEIRDSGIQLGAGNYEGRRFTMALVIGSQKVDLSVPVAIPIYNGLEDPRSEYSVGRLEIGSFTDNAGDLDLTVAMANLVPELGKDPFTLTRPSISHALRHNFKALLVIPGSIGYLHQFYRVNAVVFNALDASSPYVVSNLSATYNPPPAADGIGALRLASRMGEGIDDSAQKPLRAADAEGRPGQGENRIRGGESASATFFLEAMKLGNHPLDFIIQGQFEGGDLSSPIPLRGIAQGKVLVRNPTFNLMLVHPDVVRKGEIYILEARLTNTSQTLANDVSLSIDKARLGNVKLVESDQYPAVQKVDTLKPGDTVSFKFQLKALRNGEVIGSYLYVEDGTIGFQLSTGLGERNIRLNPDTLRLPKTLDGLPADLREAMLRVLGQAYSIATTKGVQPPGVLPIQRSMVTGDIANALSEQGLFLKMGTERTRIWWDLWKLFTHSADPGFDQLMRTTDAGAQLRKAFLEAWPWADPLQGPAERLKDFATYGDGATRIALMGIEGAKPGLSVSWVNSEGQVLQNVGALPALSATSAAWAEANGFHLAQFPMVDSEPTQLVLTNNGTEAQDLTLELLNPVAGEVSPVLNRFSLRLGQHVSASFELGPTRQLSARLTSAAGGFLEQVSATSTQEAPAEPFRVLGVHRYDIDLFPDATPYGTQVMVLFNRPTMPISIPGGDAGFQAASALIQVEGNQFWRKVMPADPSTGAAPPPPPALIKAYPRVVSLYLEKPVGPYIQRNLTLSTNWKDSQARALQGATTWPIQCGWVPGGAIVKGKVRKLDGTGLPAKLTYWYYSQTMSFDQVDLNTNIPFVSEGVNTFYSLVSNNVDTEADGSFQLDFVPEPVSFALGPFLLQADLPEGRAFAQASVLGNGQVIQMDLVLEGKGSVEGYILDAQGNPVPGTRIQAIQEQPTYGLNFGTGGGSFSVSGVSEADGHYRLDGLKTGVFSMRALKDLYGVAASGSIEHDGQVVRKDLVLKGKTGSIKVQLIGLNGQPVLDQFVRLGFPGGLLRDGSGAIAYVYPEQATAEGDGWVRFKDVPAGDIHLLAPYVVGKLATEFKGYLEAGQELSVTLHMLNPDTALAKARFLVLDASGRPVSGAYVRRHPQDDRGRYCAQTGEDGLTDWVSLRPEASVTAFAFHPNWLGETGGDSLLPHAGGEYVLRVTMPARAPIQGFVRRPDGTPVKGAYVAIPPVYDDNNKNRLCITNDRGWYLISNAPIGAPFRLAVVGPDLRTCDNKQVQLTDGQALGLDLVLPFVGNNVITGTVYQPQEGTQKTPAMAQVWVTGELPSIDTPDSGNENWGLPWVETTGAVDTPPTGVYTLRNLPSGPFTLSASSDIFPVAASIKDDFGAAHSATQTHDLTLIPSFAGELKGRITARDGQTPAPRGTRVILTRIVPPGFVGASYQVSVQDNGIYKFAKVIPAGGYKLRAEDPLSGDITVTNLDMKLEESQVRNLRLWGVGTLKIHVQDSLGRVLPEGVITLVHSKNQSGLLEANDLPELAQKLLPAHNGELSFEDLLEGSITVFLKNPTGLQGVASAEIPVGGGNSEVTVRLQPIGGIRGLLRRADGTVVPAGRVDAYGNLNGTANSWLGVSPSYQEGVEGRFLFYPLPAGTVRLEAWDPDSRQVGRATVTVKPEEYTEVTIDCMDKGPVAIQVLGENLTPVLRAGLSVQYTGGPALGFTTEATADTEGKASFFLPPGAYNVFATDPVTLTTGSLDFTRAADQDPLSLTLVLRGVRSLFASVVPPEGAPGLSLEGWKLNVDTFNRGTTLDVNGQGTLTDLPIGSYTVRVSEIRGRYRGKATVSVTKEGGAIQPFTLNAIAYGTVVVRVKNADGHPIPNLQPTLGGGLWSGACPYTDNNGEAVFLNVQQGTGSASATGTQHVPFTLEREGQVVTVDLITAPTAGIHGIVMDPLGNPMPFISVQVAERTGATDSSGAFRFTELSLNKPMSVYALTNSGRMGWSESFTLTQAHEDRETNVTLQATGRLQGRLSDVLRPQLPPMAIHVSGPTGIRLATSSTDGSGSYQIEGLPAGQTLRFQALWDDGHTVALEETFTIPGEGQTVTLERTLPAFVNLKGWTLDSERNKIPMTVILRDAQGYELKRAVTTGDLFDPDHPTFFFRYLKAGQTYRLDGCREMTNLVIASMSYVPTGIQEMETVELCQPAPRTIRLQSRFPDGSPTPGPGHFVITSTGLLSASASGDLASDGSATVTGLPEGPYDIQVSGIPNQPLLNVAFIVNPDPGAIQEVTIPAVGLGSLEIAVKTASGRVLSGSALTVSGSGTPTWSGVPQADGSWRVSGVWIGRALNLEASGFGILGTRPGISLAQHGQNMTVVYPAPDQGALAGVVRDPQGNPVGGAQVTLRNYAGASRLTDASGSFRFEPLPVGAYDVLVTLPGHPNRVQSNVTLGADGEVQLKDLNLKGTGSVRVTVLKDDGSAYAGQTVSLRNTSPDSDGQTHTGVSDANGLATFTEVLEGAISVTATLDGRFRSSTGTLRNSGSLELMLRSRDVSRLVGRVRRAGAANAWPAGTTFLVQGFTYALQGDGTLVPPSPEPLLDYVNQVPATVKLPSGVGLSLSTITLELNGLTTVDLQAPAFGVVQGMVRDYQNAIVPGAVVQSGSLQTTTDASGAYRLEGLRMGSCYLVATIPGHAPRGTASATLVGDGEVQPLNITLKGTGIVQVTTQASDGSALAGATVSLKNDSSWSDGSTVQVISDASGHATFAEVLEGSITVSATLESLSCAASGTLAIGQTVQLTLKPQPYTTISGRVQRANTALAWPQGTRLRVNGQRYDMATDGTIQVPANSPHLSYGNGTAQAYVDLNLGGPLSLGLVTLVKNGDTVLDLQAPAFGKIQGRVEDSGGTPIAGASLRLNGAAYTKSDASGAYAFTGVAAGSHTVTAQTSTAIASGTTSLVDDDGTATLNLVLQPNTVTLPVNITAGRGLNDYAYVRADGSVNFRSRILTPRVSVDGAASEVPKAPSNIARWLERNRQIAYTAQMGSVEVTVIRTVGQDSYLLRDEIRFKNADSTPHRVSLDMAHYVTTWYQDSIRGLSSGESRPVLLGPNRDAGFVSTQGSCLMWGDGSDIPASVTASANNGSTQGHIIWPEWTLAPGEEKSIALAVGPYHQDSASSNWREIGARRMLGRIQHGAPEWTYASNGAIWSNWAPAQTPVADALVPWSATFKATIKDALGRDVVNPGAILMNLKPAETLAQTWTSGTASSTLNALPPDGAALEFTLPGGSPQLRVTRTIAQTQNTEFVLQEGAPIVAEIKDSHGDPVANAQVSFSNFVSVSSDVQGLVGPMLFTPGSYEVKAYMPDSSNLVTATATVSAQAGVDNRITLSFPATGQVRVRILGEGAQLFAAGGTSAELRDQNNQNRYASSSTGILEWQNLLPGTWTLKVRDPRTSGYLPEIQVQVSADAWTETSVQLSSVAQINLQVLTPSGGPAAQNIRVSGTASDGSSFSGYTNASGVVNLLNVAPGTVTLSASNPQNGLYTTLTLTVAPGAQVSATVQLSGSGTLNFSLNTADGRPIRRDLRIRDDFGWSRYVSTDGTGKATVTPLPTGRTLTLTDDYYSDSGPWNPIMPSQTFTFTQDGEQQSFTGTKPLGKAILRLMAGPVPQSGVGFAFRILGQQGNPTNGYGTTGADGCLTILDVPLNQGVVVTATRGALTRTSTFTLVQGDMVVDIPWPQSSGKVLAHLQRANGQPASTADVWNWSANPVGESGQNPPAGVDALWTELAVDTQTTLQVSGQRRILLAGSSESSVLDLTASVQVTPTDTLQEVTLRLPTFASARLRFADAQGQVLTGSLGATPIYAWIASAPNARLVNRFLILGSFEDALFNDMFETGDYVIKLTSDHWGELGQVNFTVLPTQDGQVLDVPMTLDWVQTPYSVNVVAGDHLTPVPSAFIYRDSGNGNEIGLGYMPEVPDETSRVEGSFWGPRAGSFSLKATYEPQGRARVEMSGPTVPAGETCTQTLELPLTVLRARLTEMDGSELEGFQATFQPADLVFEGRQSPRVPKTIHRGEVRDPNPGQSEDGGLPLQSLISPQAILGGQFWSLILGQPEGVDLALTLVDPSSGLGKQLMLPAPGLPGKVDTVQALPEHGWLTGAQILGQDPSTATLLAVSKDAPGLVRPDLAAWIWDPALGFLTTPWSSEVVIDVNSRVFGYPNFGDNLGPRVRIPLTGTLWGALVNAVEGLSLDGTFGTLDFALSAEQSLLADLPQAQWTFAATPLKVTAPQDQDPNVNALTIAPVKAPFGWRMEDAYSYDSEQGLDAQRIWHPKLPVGIPLRLETQNFGCGTWWYGFLDMTAVDPAPALPQVLPATESRGVECPPS